METPLAICLFFTIFIARGVSLQCQKCNTDGKNCDSGLVECTSANDTCGTIQSELHKPNKQSIAKKCIPSKDCDKGIAIIDMGKNGIEVRKVSCCSEKDCQKKTPSWPLPTRNTTSSKNKKCSACYSMENQCNGDTIVCTGDGEDFCVEVYQNIDAGGKKTSATMKGCANKAFCDSMQSLFPAGITVLSTSKCTPASGAVRLAPGLFGFFLVAQAGLLFPLISPQH